MAASPIQPTGIIPIIRSVGGITPDITIEESHQDQLVITDHPVEQGATISDHAYKLPAQVMVTYGWTPGGPTNASLASDFLNTLYAKILAIQTAVSLFQVFTGKRIYNNMLMQGVTLTTDKNTENALVVRMLCREIPLVQTRTVVVSLDPTTQASPNLTQPTANQGTQKLQNATTFQPANGNTLIQAPKGS